MAENKTNNIASQASNKNPLDNMRKAIERAINKFETFVKSENHARLIMNEYDFQWRLANYINEEIDEKDGLTLHTEVNHKRDNEFTDLPTTPEDADACGPDRCRVDMLLLYMDKFNDPDDNGRRKYDGASFAIELKFFREKTAQNNNEDAIKKDFEKRLSLDSNSGLYVIHLIDMDDNYQHIIDYANECIKTYGRDKNSPNFLIYKNILTNK